jgi:hypothetical protein
MSNLPIIRSSTSTSLPYGAGRGRTGDWRRVLRAGLTLTSVVLVMIAASNGVPRAHADAVAYLIEVTVRPGYNFANADEALAYGQRLCDKVARGRTYSDLIGDVRSDFNTNDEFEASYLIDKAINELCPEQIWQLRNSAAPYRPHPE